MSMMAAGKIPARIRTWIEIRIADSQLWNLHSWSQSCTFCQTVSLGRKRSRNCTKIGFGSYAEVRPFLDRLRSH